MKRQALGVIVSTNSERGTVVIEQEDSLGNESAIVEIHPDQVDLLVVWLSEAKAELCGPPTNP